jgi:hypothetical protein
MSPPSSGLKGKPIKKLLTAYFMLISFLAYSIVEKACLLIRCIAMDLILLLAYSSAGMCLPSRCLAMGLYVTIFLPCAFVLPSFYDISQPKRCAPVLLLACIILFHVLTMILWSVKTLRCSLCKSVNLHPFSLVQVLSSVPCSHIPQI